MPVNDRGSQMTLPDPENDAKGFFSNHARFGKTSTVASNLKRLDFRYSHIIERNKALLEGMRVLDIASHDARFTFAALVGANARHVTGIEARQNLVDNAEKNLAHFGVPEDQFTLVCGDVFEKLRDIEHGSIDTAMVLGFLYHTARQYELISMISEIGVKNIIVDSLVLGKTKAPIIKLEWEGTTADAKIWDASRSKVLSSTPSAAALRMILEEFGYKVDAYQPEIAIPDSAKQYRIGGRVSMVATKD